MPNCCALWLQEKDWGGRFIATFTGEEQAQPPDSERPRRLGRALFLSRDRQGALNFYAAEPEAFEADAIPLAAIFASYTSLTLLNIVHEKEIFDLERALESNREIGVAMGI